MDYFAANVIMYQNAVFLVQSDSKKGYFVYECFTL